MPEKCSKVRLGPNTAISNQQGSFSDPEDAKEALAKISDEYRKNPTEKNRKRYIKLANEVSEAKVNG